MVKDAAPGRCADYAAWRTAQSQARFKDRETTLKASSCSSRTRYMVAGFDFVGGVPKSILYDNSKLAVTKIEKGGKRLP
jgi:transposase